MFIHFSVMMIIFKKKGKKFDQHSYDLFFHNIENNLREMGFGDIAVNKKMKTFITAFYGRIAQYNKSYDNYFEKKDKSLLSETILNNIYKGKTKDAIGVDWFINYMNKNIENFIDKSENENLSKYFKFTF